ncbi:MAG: AMP-binding protein, partial [Bacteroidetes bacterium]|nr:AMP-binding protein [Bacteroidota bacterium]
MLWRISNGDRGCTPRGSFVFCAVDDPIIAAYETGTGRSKAHLGEIRLLRLKMVGDGSPCFPLVFGKKRPFSTGQGYEISRGRFCQMAYRFLGQAVGDSLPARPLIPGAMQASAHGSGIDISARGRQQLEDQRMAQAHAKGLPALAPILRAVHRTACRSGEQIAGGHPRERLDFAALRADVDDPVGGLHHVEIVLDHYDGVARLDQLVQHLQKLAHILEMQTGRRLVEDVERAPRRTARQLLGQLHPLRLAARQRRRLLAEMDIAEADALAGVEPDDIAELVFTSGTTGSPKGVILTHRNIFANVGMAAPSFQVTPNNRVLAILPLSHMFEQIADLFVPVSAGASVVYLSSLRPDVIFAAMAHYHITNMGLVPRVLELFADGIKREARRQNRLSQLERAHSLACLLPFSWRRRMFKKIHQRMGGCFEYFVVGGARLEVQRGRWWEGVGVKVVQGDG